MRATRNAHLLNSKLSCVQKITFPHQTTKCDLERNCFKTKTKTQYPVVCLASSIHSLYDIVKYLWWDLCQQTLVQTLIASKLRSTTSDIRQNVLTRANSRVPSVAFYTRRTHTIAGTIQISHAPAIGEENVWPITDEVSYDLYFCYNERNSQHAYSRNWQISSSIQSSSFVKNYRLRLGVIIITINVLSRYNNTACLPLHLQAYLCCPSEHVSVCYTNLETGTIHMHVVCIYTHIMT
jgi:hypothetical protein